LKSKNQKDLKVEWQRPPEEFHLSEGEVHVWKIFPKESHVSPLPFTSILSPDEIQKAERFQFEKHRIQSSLSQGLLRTLLGNYLNKNSQEISFVRGERGKPYLSPEANYQNLQFNISHSHGVILLAFTIRQEVGVDVEKIQRQKTGEGIAKKYFTQREYNFLNSQAPEKKAEAFFTLWVLKEAFLKACGQGLFESLKESLKAIECQWEPESGGVDLVSLSVGAEKHPSPWARLFSPESEYRAALVGLGEVPKLRFFDGSSLLP